MGYHWDQKLCLGGGDNTIYNYAPVTLSDIITNYTFSSWGGRRRLLIPLQNDILQSANCQLLSILPGYLVLNPLTTDDTFWRHLTLVACYQLAHSDLKIGSVLVKRWDRGRWVGIVMTCRAHGSQVQATHLLHCFNMIALVSFPGLSRFSSSVWV